MNDTLKTIYERRAVRKYKNIPVEKELITQVIDAGCMAPSAINKQPWKFYVLTNHEKIKEISKDILAHATIEVKNIKLKDTLKTALSFFHLSNIVDFLCFFFIFFFFFCFFFFFFSTMTKRLGGGVFLFLFF